jgi:ElaB/YqjD/DUF883 family membrane-anchored ribosome-binding protein
MTSRRAAPRFSLDPSWELATPGLGARIALNRNQEGIITMDNQQSAINAEQRLVTDMKSAIADAEDMLQATADQAGEKMVTLRARIQERLQGAKVRLSEAEAALLAKSRAAARATDTYVHESPWTAVGIAAAVGLLVGLIIGRR